jgi:hypothetical protein
MSIPGNIDVHTCVLETQGLSHGQIDPYTLLACHYLDRDYPDYLVCYPLPS